MEFLLVNWNLGMSVHWSRSLGSYLIARADTGGNVKLRAEKGSFGSSFLNHLYTNTRCEATPRSQWVLGVELKHKG